MLPQVHFDRSDGNTGVVRPGAEGILAIVAPGSTGTVNVAGSYTRDNLVQSDYGYGRLTSFAAYALPITQAPIVAVRSAASTVGAYGTITTTGGGTSAVTAGATEPLDELNVAIKFIVGATVGVTGATYQTSLDGGDNYGPITGLGTANTIAIPKSGVGVALGAGTLIAGELITFKTTAPAPTTIDLVDSLEALRVSSQPWDAVLVDGVATTATVAQIDTWLAALEVRGKFKTAIVNVRRRSAGETEAVYAAAITALSQAAASTRVVVCADGADSTDAYLGVLVPRPTSLFVAVRGESIDIAEDAAYVARGPLANCIITDARGNPKYHDEAKYPTLDDLRYAVLRSFDDRSGAFVNNPNLFSASGSDYVYWQHARVMNKACEIAWQILTTQLSAGVQKSNKIGPNGARYIAETAAQRIEGLINAGFTNPLEGRCTAAQFTLSRTDDISSNAGARVTGFVEIVPLSYVKRFDVTDRFVKQITAAAA